MAFLSPAEDMWVQTSRDVVDKDLHTETAAIPDPESGLELL